MTTNNKNYEHCKGIARELEKYASNEYFLYNGDLYHITPEDFEEENKKHSYYLDDNGFYYYDFGNGDRIEESEIEAASLWDYFEDIYDINYILNSYKELEAVRIMVACGGPNIYINTWDKQVELYWWNESATYPLNYEVCDEINDYFTEFFNC